MSDQSFETRVSLALLLATSLASLWGSSVIINAFFIFGKGRGFATMVLFLALGDFVWALTSVAASLVLLIRPDLYSMPLCTAFRISYQFGAFSSLVWGLGILFFILLVLARVKRHEHDADEGNVSKGWWFALGGLALGYPLVIGIVMVATGSMERPVPGFLCFPTAQLEQGLWVYPIVGVFAVSVALMGIVIYHYQSYRNNQSSRIVGRSVTLTVPFRSSLFSLVLLLCWTPNVLYQLIGGPFWFNCLWIVMLNTQGLWDSFIYGLTNGRFRAFFRKRCVRTVALLMFGPLLVFPLFVRWLVRSISRKCATVEGQNQPLSVGFDAGDRSPPEDGPMSGSSSTDNVTSGSFLVNEPNMSKSLFPLSSHAHPLPEMYIATSFTPPPALPSGNILNKPSGEDSDSDDPDSSD